MPFDIGPTRGIRAEELEPVSATDFFYQNIRDAERVSNQKAREFNLTEAYDRVNKRIADATGAKDLENPMVADASPFNPVQRLPDEAYNQPWRVGKSPMEAWKYRIGELRKSHPDALPWDGLENEPERIANETMLATRNRTNEMTERTGMVDGQQIPGLRHIPIVRSFAALAYNAATSPKMTAAQLGGGFVGALKSPVDAGVNLLGFGAGKQTYSLVKNAAINAGVNFGAQVPLSAMKQEDYRKAGLPAGWDVALQEAEGAAAAGFGIDLATRAPGHAVRALRGKTEGHGGVFTDAERTLDLPKAPDVRPEIPQELVARAEAGDATALREIAEKAGVLQDPAVRGALNHYELTGKVDEDTIKFFRDNGIDTGEGLKTLASVMRHPEMYFRVPEAVRAADAPLMREDAGRLMAEHGERVREALAAMPEDMRGRVQDLVEAGIPKVVEAVKSALEAKDPAAVTAKINDFVNSMGGAEKVADLATIHGMRGGPVRIAEAMRRSPEFVDSNVSLEMDLMKGARAIAALDDAAFSRVQAGEVQPAVAAVVADMVPPGMHGRVMDDLLKAGVQSARDAVDIIPDLVPRAKAEMPLNAGAKIDDPAGPAAKAQTKLLEAELAPEIEEAMRPILAKDAADEAIFKAGQEAKALEVAQDAELSASPHPLHGAVQNVMDAYSDFQKSGGTEERRATQAASLDAQSAAVDIVNSADPTGQLRAGIGELLNLVTRDGKGLDDPRVMELLQRLTGDTAEAIAAQRGDFIESIRRSVEGMPEADRQPFVDSAVAGYDRAFPATEALSAKRAEIRASEVARIDAKAAVEGTGPDLLYRMILESAGIQRAIDVRRAIDDALRLANRILPEGTKVTIETGELRDPVSGHLLDATADTTTGDIVLASYALNPAARLSHESLHTLVTRGHVSPEEVALLAKAARESGAFSPEMEAKYRDAYKDRANLESLIAEEAAAHFVEARLTGTTPAHTIADRIRATIQRIRNALNGYGFKTAEDVRDAVLRGDMARREAVQAWMRSEDITAVAAKPMFAIRDYITKTGIDHLAEQNDATPITKLRPWSKHPGRVLAFHGTDTAPFDRFNLQYSNDFGIHFGTPGQANKFASGDTGYKTYSGQPGTMGHVMPVVLDLKKVVDVKDLNRWAPWELINSLESKGAMISPETKKLSRGASLNEVQKKAAYHQIRAELEAQGIDGIRYLNGGEGGGITWSYIAIKPDSVTSATTGHTMFAFAGERAKTADHAALSLAKQMEKDGRPREDIWTSTGWFKGVDGKWRFEIDDSGAKNGAKAGALGTVLDHSQLYDAYPRLADVQVETTPWHSPSIGSYSPGANGSTASIDYSPVQAFFNGGRKSVLSHEAQHGIQMDEGFAQGGNGWSLIGLGSEAETALFEEQLAKITGGKRPTFADFEKAGEMAAREAYKRQAGEVEARTVQKRMDLTPEERRSRPPWLDYDVPEDQQFVRGVRNSETMFAIADADTGRAMRSDLDALGYYSGALRAAKSLRQSKGTPEQMLAMLQKEGAKKAEIEATGLDKFLSGKSSVTKDEIVGHLEQNRVGLNEVQKARIPPEKLDELALKQRGVPYAELNDAQRRNVEAAAMRNDDGATKWHAYSLDPSNPTYRETVLHLPESERLQPIVEVKQRSDGYWTWDVRGTNISEGGTERTEAEARAKVERAIARSPGGMKRDNPNDFRSGHFPEPNITGHLMTSMTKHEGRPVYTIDQIQSDWGQKLRDGGGTRDESKIAVLKAQLADATAKEEAFAKTTANAMFLTPEQNAAWAPLKAERQRLAAELRNADSAPSAGHPLVNTTDQWTTTTLRRAIRQAAEADADYIAIPTGDTVLSYNPGDDHGMESFYGAKPNPRAIESLRRELADVEAGRISNLDADYLRKRIEIAEKGLEGIVPKNLRKLLQKIDRDSPPSQKIDKLETPTSGMKGEGFTLFPLTDKVKASVLQEGQAMFAIREEDGSISRRDSGAVTRPDQQAGPQSDRTSASLANVDSMNQLRTPLQMEMGIIDRIGKLAELALACRA